MSGVARRHLHVIMGTFFVTLLMNIFFLRFFLDCLWCAIWLYFEFVVKYFSGSLFMAKGWFYCFF